MSGTKKIDERAGMRTLFRLITEHRIGAVACQREDRLFRDETQVQVDLFIEACRSAGVVVLTPTTLYDFNHPTGGEAHAHRFRTRAAAGAAYLTGQIEGKIHPAAAACSWTPAEDARLAALFRQGAGQLEIARAFPNRTWGSLEQRYWQVVAPVDRVKVRRRRLLRQGETYAEYAERQDKRR